MDDTVLEKMIATYLGTRQKVYSFGWQGGEPTLLGSDFFRKVTSLQERYGKPGSVVSNGLQTNGTLIDNDLAEHFKTYHFLLGVSLDGPQALHDVYRKKRDGSGTYRDVIRGIEILNSHGVEYNALVLVTKANVAKPVQVYRHLKELGIFYHQYIPCVEFDESGKPEPWTITGEEWGMFLRSLFRQWTAGDVERVSIRNFDAVLQLLVHNREVMCTMGRNCRQYFVVEYSGDVYPCDFFVEPKLKLGNIMGTGWEELKKTKEYARFGRKKSEWPGECGRCAYLLYCAGDCLKHRRNRDDGTKQESWLCDGWKSFYGYSLPGFHRLREVLKSG